LQWAEGSINLFLISLFYGALTHESSHIYAHILSKHSNVTVIK